MTLTSTEFFNYFPAFESCVSPDTVDVWLELACQYVDYDVWGDKAKFGHALVVAHNLTYLGVTEEAVATASSALKREKVGDLEVEYQNESSGSKDLDGLDSTPYGRQFKTLRRTIIMTPLVVGKNSGY